MNEDLKRASKKSWISIICHQKPERCFKIRNKPLPLCSRCLGFYPGIFIGVLFCFVFPRILEFDPLTFLIISAIFVAPMGIDGITQYRKLRESNNFLRFITGILAGSGVGLLAGRIIVDIVS